MSGWKYVSIVVLLLLGGIIYFGYWAYSQHNLALDAYSASYAQLSASFATYTKTALSWRTATSTAISEISTTTPQNISTSSPIIISTSATSTDLKLAFVLPNKDNEIYAGCTYQIPLQSTTTIRSLGVTLIDAGTREAIGPIASGLAKESAIEKGSQNLKWKVGAVWPGTYYFKVSSINGVDAEIRSKVFRINKVPVDMPTDEKMSICKGSGGLL